MRPSLLHARRTLLQSEDPALFEAFRTPSAPPVTRRASVANGGGTACSTSTARMAPGSQILPPAP